MARTHAVAFYIDPAASPFEPQGSLISTAVGADGRVIAGADRVLNCAHA
jgi:hypothetical protein